MDAAEAEHHQMAEITLTAGAEDDLKTTDHRLQQDAVRLGDSHKRSPGGQRLGFACDTKAHPADIGLMQGTDHLHRQGKAELAAGV